MNFIKKCWGAISKWFSSIIKLAKTYWDILGGTATGLFLSWLASWEFNEIQVIYSIIILILVCIGLFKVVKNSLDKRLKRKKIVIDTIVNSQKPMKAIEIANNPTKSGEELGETIIESMKGWRRIMQKIKNLFVWIGKYWQQLLGIVASLGEYALYVFALLKDYFDPIFNLLPQGNGWQIGARVVISLIVALLVILQIRNMCKWVGVGSLEDAEKYIAEKTENAKSKLSPTAKKTIEHQLKLFNNKLKEVNKAISTIEAQIKEVESKISSVKELIDLGIGNVQEFNDLNGEHSKLILDLNTKKNEQTNLQTNIAKFKNVL